MIKKTHMRWIAGSALMLALAGALWANGSAQAQTVTATPAAATTPAAAITPGATVLSNTQSAPPGMGGPGGMGKAGGMGGPGGGAATADGATNMISRATQAISAAKDDLAYATGKMDTGSVQGWLSAADNRLAQAQAAQTAQQYGQAVAEAGVAQALARTAETAMAQALGAANLPSASQQPGPGGLRGP